MSEERLLSTRGRGRRVYKILAFLVTAVVTVLVILESLASLGLLSVLIDALSMILLENVYTVPFILSVPVIVILLYFVSKKWVKSKKKLYDEAIKGHRNAERLLSIARNIQELDDARAEFSKALKLFEKSAQPKFLFDQPYKIKMRALSHKGLYSAEAKKGNNEGKKTQLDVALNLLEETAMMYERKKDDARNAAQCYRLIGQLYIQEKNTIEAERYFLKALQLFQRDSQYWETASCYKEIARISEDLEKKEVNLLKAAEEYETDGNLWESAITYKHLGHIFRNNNQLDKAIDNLKKAAERFLEDVYFWEGGETFFAIGEIYKNQNKPSEAREYFLKAAECFEIAGYEREKQKAIREVAHKN